MACNLDFTVKYVKQNGSKMLKYQPFETAFSEFLPIDIPHELMNYDNSLFCANAICIHQ